MPYNANAPTITGSAEASQSMPWNITCIKANTASSPPKKRKTTISVKINSSSMFFNLLLQLF